MAIDYTIDYDEGADLVRVQARGVDESLEEVQRYGTAVIDACRHRNCSLVLVDERELTYRLSTGETYELGQYYAAFCPQGVLRVALVVNQSNLEDAEFFETVTFNRGLQFNIFTSMDEALAWLKQLQA